MAKGPSRKSRGGGNRRAQNPRRPRTSTIAGPVTITRADGSVSVEPAPRGNELRSATKPKPRRKKGLDPAWSATRALHLQTYPECRACEAPGEVVHHLRYRGHKRGVGERPGDLMTLCRNCHDDLHRCYDKKRVGKGWGDLPEFSINYAAQIRATLA